MNYKKVKQTELEGLTQKEGEDLLFAAGYVKDDDYSDRDEYKVGKYYHYDQYYTLYDEEENELDKVSFVTIYQKAEEYMEDDTFVRTCLYFNQIEAVKMLLDQINLHSIMSLF